MPGRLPPIFVEDFEMRLCLTLFMLKSVLAERPIGGRDSCSIEAFVAAEVPEWYFSLF